MKLRRTLMLAVAIVTLPVVAHAGHDDKAAIDRERYLKQVNQLLKDLEELEDRNENNPHKQDRKWIRERLGAMREDLVGMRADLQAAPPAGPRVPPPPPPLPPPPPATPQAMTDAEYSSFVAELRKQSFDKERLGLLKEVASEAWFTTDQVIQTMGLFSFSSEKVAAGAAMYPRVVDRQNWYKVYSTLTFSSDQEKLRKLTSGR